MTSRTIDAAPVGTPIHRRARWLRIIWRLRGIAEWLAQKVTPESWWNRRSVPGTILVATNSPPAHAAIIKFLESRLRRGLFGVNSFEAVEGQDGRDRREKGRLVVSAWKVEVNRGTEQAVLRDLEYAVAVALERDGGYPGIDPKLSAAIARRSIAAHQARRVIPTMKRRPIPTAPVEFEEPAHSTYVSMIADGHDPAREPRKVTVAILDSAVDPEHLAQGVNVPVESGALAPEQENRPCLAHGVVTASIIGSLAPSARIVVYPVVSGYDDVPDENDLIISLIRAVSVTQADVIVMCLQLPEHNGRSVRATLDFHLDGVGDRPVVVASSGNRDAGGSDDAWYPGIHPAVMMVGAVDSAHNRPEFSCYALRDRPRPALFVVAPGGGGPRSAPHEYSVTVGVHRMVGTSVAAAYAAGVVARSIAEADQAPERSADFYEMLAARAVKFPGWDKNQHGRGLIRQLASP